MPSTVPQLNRRRFLLGVAAASVLAACGSSDGDTGSSGGDTGSSDGDAGSSPVPSGSGPANGAGSSPVADGRYVLVQRFPQDVQEVGTQRLPVSLASADGGLIQDGPPALSAVVTDVDGQALGEPITAVRRDVAPGPYYAFRTEITDAGVFYLVVDGGPEQGAAFQVMDAGTVAVPGPGDALPPFDTPTIEDPRGVDPVCTRDPEPCPFHDLTLSEALESGKGVVYLIGTPAFCQTGTCAPALESIIDIADDYADRYVFVHAEVYTDDTATVPAPAIEAAGLTYEPALFVTDADGIVVERLDAVWNRDELVETLDRI